MLCNVTQKGASSAGSQHLSAGRFQRLELRKPEQSGEIQNRVSDGSVLGDGEAVRCRH